MVADSPSPDPEPSSTYLVCATPRTGSYLLCDLLSQTGFAGRPTEYFSAGYQAYWSPRWQVTGYADYLRRIRAAGTGPNGVLGVKAHPRQFKHFVRQASGVAELPLEEHCNVVEAWLPNCRYVWLRRRDERRQAMSWAKSMQTNVWWDASEAPAPFDEPTPEAIRFDFAFLEHALARMRFEDRMWGEYFDASGTEPLTIWYEDLAADPVAILGRVLDFLGLAEPARAFVPATSFRRQTDSTTERWLSRFNALESVKLDANLRSTRRVEVDHPDLIVASGEFGRPGDWDESRHSLFAVEPYSGPFKPDYSLATPATTRVTPSPDIRFTTGVRESIDAIDIPLTESAISGLRGPALTLTSGRRELAAAISAHLGADRVGVLLSDSEQPSWIASDRDTTRVLEVLADNAAHSGHQLDLSGFLQLPRRPCWERQGFAGLRIAVVAGSADPGWCHSLVAAINALTRHVAVYADTYSSAFAAESVMGDADVVFAAHGVLGPNRYLRARVIAVSTDAAFERPGFGLALRASGGEVRCAPWPLDWWVAAHRPLPKPAMPTVYVTANDNATPDHDAAQTADRIRAAVGRDARVVEGSPASRQQDLERRRSAHVLVDLAPDGFSADSLLGLAHACVVVNRLAAGTGKLDPDSFGSKAMPPFVCSTESDVGFAVRMLIRDRGELEQRGTAGRDWLRVRWDFTEQWDTYWMPVIARALAGAPGAPTGEDW
jgi:trehalose 2-sulfotransferase